MFGVYIQKLSNIIYSVAKEKNREALTNIVEKNARLNILQSASNSIILLAKEGDSTSVEFLINQFKEGRNDAVLGYAIGGHVEQVNEQILKGADYHAAVRGYVFGGHIQQKNILQLLSVTDNQILRKLLVQEVQLNLMKEKNRKIESFDSSLLLKKAIKLNQLIREKGITFNQAQGYLRAGANGWLFQGQQLVSEGWLFFPQLIVKKAVPDTDTYRHILSLGWLLFQGQQWSIERRFNPEIYFHILSFVLGCSKGRHKKSV